MNANHTPSPMPPSPLEPARAQPCEDGMDDCAEYSQTMPRASGKEALEGGLWLPLEAAWSAA